MNFIFDGIKLILRSQVWWSGTRLRSPSTEQFAAFVATWHTTVGELLAWEREPKFLVKYFLCFLFPWLMQPLYSTELKVFEPR